MSKLTDVLDFMAALHKSEKRYVSMRLKQDKEQQKKKTHLDLFELLNPLLKDTDKDKAQIYQVAESLKQKKKWAHLFATVNVIKLHDFLLDCLRQFNADKPLFRIEGMIQDIRILQQKGLFQQALGVIKKVKKELTERYENELKTFEVLQLERRIFLAMRQPDYEALAALQKASRIQWEKVRVILETTDDYENILYRIRRLHFQTDFSLSTINSRLQDDMEVVADLPFEANLQALATLSHYYIYVDSDPDRAIAYIQKLLEQFENHKYRKNRYPENYVQSLILFFNRSVQADRIKAFAPTIQKIRAILSDNTDLFPNAVASRNQIELSTGTVIQYRLMAILANYYNYNWSAADAPDTMDQMALLLRRKPNIPAALLETLYFNIASYNVLTSNLERARLFLDHIFATYPKRGGSDKENWPFEAEILEGVLLFEQSRKQADKEQAEQKLAYLLGIISQQKKEVVKRMARSFISRLNLLLFEADNQLALNTFKSMLKSLDRKEAARHGFITFRLWVDKKIAELS